MKARRLMIQDFDSTLDDGDFFYAGPKTVRCKGCFECWLKMPGKCCMADHSEMIGSRIAVTERVIIISKSIYGGFAAPVKRVLDRSIPGVLPFFGGYMGVCIMCRAMKASQTWRFIFTEQKI